MAKCYVYSMQFYAKPTVTKKTCDKIQLPIICRWQLEFSNNDVVRAMCFAGKNHDIDYERLYDFEMFIYQVEASEEKVQKVYDYLKTNKTERLWEVDNAANLVGDEMILPAEYCARVTALNIQFERGESENEGTGGN